MLAEYHDDREEALKRLSGRQIGAVSALRYVRLAQPDTTEEERKSLLWDAVRQDHVAVYIGRQMFARITLLPPGGTTVGHIGVHEDVFWREALFSEADVARVFPPSHPHVRTKATIPVAELTAEMHRRAANGERASRWSPEAAALSRWAKDALPRGTPHSHSAIRGHPLLKAEYDKLESQR